MAIYPGALLFSLVPGTKGKHLFSLILGVLFLQFSLRETWIHSLVSSSLCYLCILTLPRSLSPRVVFLISVFWVVITHFNKMFHLDALDEPCPEPDPSGAQMVLTIKLTSFAFSLMDGQAIASPSAKDRKVSSKILEERKERAIMSTPGPLEYFSYMLFFGGVLAGPAFDFMEFSSSIDLSKYAKLENQRPGGAKKVIPTPYWPSLQRVLISVTFLLSYVFLTPIVNYKSLSALMDEASLPGRLVWVVLAAFGEKSKYFFLWKMAEGGCILCSLGFEGYSADGTAKWDGLSNVNIVGTELAQSIRDMSVNWNRNTSFWLRRYVYERVDHPLLSLMATYMVSAFWHGFYPGFYLFFITVGIGQEITRRIRQKVRPYFMEEDGKTPKSVKVLYDLGGLVLTHCWICYCAIPFKVLTVKDTLELWGKLYYIGHVILLIPLVVLPLLPSKRLSKPPRTAANDSKQD